MKENLDLRWKELCAELALRQKGKKGEWDIPTDLLVRYWMAKRVRLPMQLVRNLPDEPKQEKD